MKTYTVVRLLVSGLECLVWFFLITCFSVFSSHSKFSCTIDVGLGLLGMAFFLTSSTSLSIRGVAKQENGACFP